MRKNKKSFWRPAAAGFGVMYLAITGLATWLVKEQFADDYGQRFREGVVSIVKKASEKEFSVEEAGEGWDGEQRKDFYQDLANEELWRVDSDRILISAAFYDEGGEAAGQKPGSDRRRFCTGERHNGSRIRLFCAG